MKKLLLLCTLFVLNPYSLLAKTAKDSTPYVLLLSLDGFRHDYLEKFEAPNIKQLAAEGVSAKGLIPVFPSKTFPNHYSIVTGMYSGNHGIVGNSFYDPVRDEEYSLMDSAAVADGSWYGGTPLWVAVEQQGLKSACYFWPGSEAEIKGTRPSYFKKFDMSAPAEQRVEQIVNWLKLPLAQRPHFLTLYFSDVDSAGHKHGTNSEELAKAITKVDNVVGQLRSEFKKLKLDINLILVSDHGMSDIDPNKVIIIEDYVDLSKFKTSGSGTQISLYSKDRKLVARKFKELKKKLPATVKAFLRTDLPVQFQLNANNRVGEILLTTDAPSYLRPKPSTRAPSKATHGFDPTTHKEMQGIFYAVGPNIARKRQIDSFENIHVYPFILDLMGLDIPENDGNQDVLKSVVFRQILSKK